jgi:RNA recognition motif-containing protein
MSTSSSSESAVIETRKRKSNRTIDKSDTPDDHADADLDEELENADDHEPALSHAEKRRRKREARRAEKLKDGDKRPKKKRKLKDGTSQITDAETTTATTTKRQNSVWVGNLSYKTQQENLQDFFKWVGDITRIHMPTKVRGGPGTLPENRGCVCMICCLCPLAHLFCSFAYVDFATPEAKIAAVALSEQPLLGRKLLIKDGMHYLQLFAMSVYLFVSSIGDNFEGRPAATTLEAVVTDPSVAHKTHSKTAQKIISAQKQSAAPTLFFGNLPFQTTEDAIRQLLDAHRPHDQRGEDGDADDEERQKDDWIRKIRMGTFEDSGLCKGYLRNASIFCLSLSDVVFILVSLSWISHQLTIQLLPLSIPKITI